MAAYKPGTLAEAAQVALDVQNASNLSGVVKAFADATTQVWAYVHGHPEKSLGTAWVNEHPISKLFVNQLMSLSHGRTLDYEMYTLCAQQCRDIIEKGL